MHGLIMLCIMVRGWIKGFSHGITTIHITVAGSYTMAAMVAKGVHAR